MKPKRSKVLLLAIVAAIAMLQLSSPAKADPPLWANAKWVKATATLCDGINYLILRGNEVHVPTRSNSPGCTSSEEIFVQVNVSKKFFRGGNSGEISASHVDAGFLSCGKPAGIIILGAPGEAERAIREHPAPRGCTYTTRKYQYLSSVGSIPFTDVANGGRMTVAESLALHAKERERAIAECNASPACQAEVSRMRSFSDQGSSSDPCVGNSRYPKYSGAGRCTDSSGNTDPEGTVVFPH
jgi:hypothetical protein